ncbi:MAG: TIGR00730 family Rossman fold protein [Chloroflexota bacterium]
MQAPRILPVVTDHRARPRPRTTEDRKLLMRQPVADTSFLESDAWRALRIMGEFIEGFDALARLGPAVSIFGSARTRRSDPMYEEARSLAARLSEEGFTVITGGGPGIMEAANRGAKEAEGISVGLGIDLPHEQGVNEYVDLPAYFRYFFVRKTMFVKYAQAFVIFPGGFGTFDELFESLTLVQTGKIDHFPIILYGSHYWAGLLEWLRSTVAEAGMVDEDDLDLVRVCDDVEEVVSIIAEAYSVRGDTDIRKPHGEEVA